MFSDPDAYFNIFFAYIYLFNFFPTALLVLNHGVIGLEFLLSCELGVPAT